MFEMEFSLLIFYFFNFGATFWVAETHILLNLDGTICFVILFKNILRKNYFSTP